MLFSLRPPSSSSSSSSSSEDKHSSFTPPEPAWLYGTWHVTHSTLPMWRTKRNVQITYTPLPSGGGDTDQQHIDDLVTYQELNLDKIKTVRGVDKPSPNVPAAWDWRGRGWLMIASSHWEILGYGEEEGEGDDGSTLQWAVTYFAKTLFTPAGIDIYARSPAGLSEETVEGIKSSLGQLGDDDVKALAGQIFQVKQDRRHRRTEPESHQ